MASAVIRLETSAQIERLDDEIDYVIERHIRSHLTRLVIFIEIDSLPRVEGFNDPWQHS